MNNLKSSRTEMRTKESNTDIADPTQVQLPGQEGSYFVVSHPINPLEATPLYEGTFYAHIASSGGFYGIVEWARKEGPAIHS